MLKNYCININGQKAIDTAKKIIGNYCYKNLGDFGLMEIVLDSDEIYNGFISKWVTLSGFKTIGNVQNALNYLRNNGFLNCTTTVSVEYINDCFADITHEVVFTL